MYRVKCQFVRISPDVAACPVCEFSIRTTKPAEKINRMCPAPRELTMRGRILIRLKPGDGVALLAKYTGTKSLVEAIKRGPCKNCGDRRAWMNRQWERLVRSHFSRLVTLVENPA